MKHFGKYHVVNIFVFSSNYVINRFDFYFKIIFQSSAYTEEIAITVMTLYNTCLVLKIQKEICCEKQFSNLPIVKCNLDAISDQIS